MEHTATPGTIRPRLPDFVVIGAPKAGTTSLARWMDAHPDIHVPVAKELRFLSRHWDQGLDWYRDQMRSDAKVVGEASPEYLAHPEAPKRAGACLPDTAFVAVLRDPVERAWSDHWFQRGWRGESVAGGEAAFRHLVERVASGDVEPAVERSRYAEQLDRWEAAVGRERLHVMTFDLVRDEPLAAWHEACRLVGLQPSSPPPAIGEVHNPTVRLRRRWVRARLIGHGIYRRFPRLAAAAERLNRAEIGYPPIPSDVAERLAEMLHDDTIRLTRWLGELPPGWTHHRVAAP